LADTDLQVRRARERTTLGLGNGTEGERRTTNEHKGGRPLGKGCRGVFRKGEASVHISFGGKKHLTRAKFHEGGRGTL